MNIIPLAYEEKCGSVFTHAVTVSYTDTTQTTLIPLPAGTLVGRVAVYVSTAWNSGTSAAVSVGTTASATAYINAVDVKAGAGTFLYNTGAAITAASQYLVVTIAVAGTAATAGKCSIGLQLVDATKLPVAA